MDRGRIVESIRVGYSPWFRLEAQREQIYRSFATVGVAVLMIAIPLAITGDELVSGVADQSVVETAVETWLGTDSPYIPAQITVNGSDMAVVIVGEGDPPPPDRLATELATALNRTIQLHLRVIPERRTVITSSP